MAIEVYEKDDPEFGVQQPAVRNVGVYFARITQNCGPLVILRREHFRFACSLLDMYNNNIIC